MGGEKTDWMLNLYWRGSSLWLIQHSGLGVFAERDAGKLAAEEMNVESVCPVINLSWTTEQVNFLNNWYSEPNEWATGISELNNYSIFNLFGFTLSPQ